VKLLEVRRDGARRSFTGVGENHEVRGPEIDPPLARRGQVGAVGEHRWNQCNTDRDGDD
jgi:hypothetical protein